MVSEAQRRAHAKHEATRKRTPLWLDPPDVKAIDKVKRRHRLPSRIAALRYVLKAEHGSEKTDG